MEKLPYYYPKANRGVARNTPKSDAQFPAWLPDSVGMLRDADASHSRGPRRPDLKSPQAPRRGVFTLGQTRHKQQRE